jgi:hypothetical protein
MTPEYEAMLAEIKRRAAFRQDAREVARISESNATMRHIFATDPAALDRYIAVQASRIEDEWQAVARKWSAA